MEETELKEYLEQFSIENNLSVDLYFVVKNLDQLYEPLLIHPDPDLKRELLEAFTAEIHKFYTEGTPYELHSVYTDNTNNGYYLYHDLIDTTQVTRDIFNFDTANAGEYRFDNGEFQYIFGFLVCIYNGNTQQELRIFKRGMPTQAMRKSKMFSLFPKADGKFSYVDKDTVTFQKSIDMFRVNNKIIIKNYKVYENDFGFDVILKRKAAASLAILLAVSGFWFSEKAIKHITNLTLTKRKKLIHCTIDNPFLVEEKFKQIRREAKRWWKHEFKTTNDSKIKIDTKKDVNTLIVVLNREINKNSGTNEVFHTPSKTYLGTYIPKPKAIIEAVPSEA